MSQILPFSGVRSIVLSVHLISSYRKQLGHIENSELRS